MEKQGMVWFLSLHIFCPLLTYYGIELHRPKLHSFFDNSVMYALLPGIYYLHSENSIEKKIQIPRKISSELNRLTFGSFDIGIFWKIFALYCNTGKYVSNM